MAKYRPRLTPEFVRMIRSAREKALREGRRPRLKPFYVGQFDPSAVLAAARGQTYRWVQ